MYDVVGVVRDDKIVVAGVGVVPKMVAIADFEMLCGVIRLFVKSGAAFSGVFNIGVLTVGMVG